MSKTDNSKLEQEIDNNFSAIMNKMDEHMVFHRGRHALMRHGEVIEFYNSWEDAHRTGKTFYKDGLFSVQEITQTPANLGYYSFVDDIT